MDLISRFSFSSSKSCTQNDFQFSQYLSNTWRNKLNPLVNHIGRRKHIRVFLENCSRRSRLLLLFTFHLSFTIFIELLAQTDRTSRYPVTGKGRKHTKLSYSFDRQYSQYSQYSYFLAITCIYQPRHANGSNSISITGEKERTFFSFFSIFHDQLKIVQKGGNRWHRNFAYLRGSAQKAIICEITRTDTCIKLNIQMYMC